MRVFILSTLLVASVANAQTYKYSILHSFQNDGKDAANPNSPLIRDSAGNLYGTSYYGGAFRLGTVFKVAANGTETVLHSFRGTPDGETPAFAPLMRDSNGNLYGTTWQGGAGFGMAFEISPSGDETILYNFMEGTSGYPTSGLVMDAGGNLYGTTQSIVNGDAAGLVFKIDTNEVFSTLHEFCLVSECTDGETPFSGLVVDRAGNFYGSTLFGGTYGGGAVYKVTPEGTETVLHSFAAVEGAPGDGFNPFGDLIQDSEGNLYGATRLGGVNDPNHLGPGGIIFKQPEGGGSETVLYNFCSLPNCADGAGPGGPLARDKSGNLYGVAYVNANNPIAAIFELSASGKLSILHTFGKNVSINYGLVRDNNGNLYGSTFTGGRDGLGVVFKLTPVK